MAEIGCPTYSVYFQPRCGESFKCKAENVTGLNYSRVLNETSTASITVALNGISTNCCKCYGEINPWEHEVSIFRDGKMVWVGPIVEITYDLDKQTATFLARDLSAWMDRRVVELVGDDYDVEGVDSKDVFEWLLQHGYCKDPWCMTWALTATGIPITKYYPARDQAERFGGTYQIIGDEMRALVEEGVDYTVVNRHMYGGNIETSPPLAQELILLDSHWARLPSIIVSGIDMSTRVIVAGGGGGNDGWYDEETWIEPPISSPILPAKLTPNQRQFGLLESFQSKDHLWDEDTTIDPNAITQNAFAKFELSSQPFVYIQGGQLSQKAPISIETLIPGARMAVRMNDTCRPFLDQYRLRSVNFSVSDVLETVDIELTPVGVDTLRGA